MGVVDGEMHEYVFDTLKSAVPINNYHCDKSFQTETVYSLIDETISNGLIVISRGHATIGKTTRAGVTKIAELESNVQGKSRAGGQSAQRFARVREKQKEAFFTKVARIARDAFITDETVNVDSIVVGGSLITVDQFTSNADIDYRLQNRIIGTYRIDHADETGLHALYEKSRGEITSKEQQQKEELLSDFFETVKTNIDTVSYGDDNIQTVAEWGAIETLLVAADESVSPALEETIEHYGGSVVTIPQRTSRYDEFVKGFGGVVALCRYPVTNTTA